MSSVPNMPEPRKLVELRELVARLCDAKLTATQAARLAEMINTDPSCAWYYVNLMQAHAMLPQSLGVRDATSGMKLIAECQSRESGAKHAVVASKTSPQKTSSKGRKPFIRRFSATSFVGLAASLLLVGYFVTMFGLLLMDRLHRAAEAIAVQVPTESPALLMHADDAEWQHEAGAKSAHRMLQVRRGFAELKFSQGAKVVVQAPAEFEVRSANGGFLRRGKLVATVPPQAIGFTIATPKAEIVDLGTEFGVEVDDHQNAEVHVFTGVVVARPAELAVAQGPGVRITAGEALRIDGQQAKFTSISIPPRQRGEFVKARLKHRAVKLQNATGTFSQPSFTVSDTLDGNVETGWGIVGGVGSNQQAVWETAIGVGGPAGAAFQFTLTHAISRQHGIGKFRLSVTTDPREKFADGLPSGGKVAANWTKLKPLAVISSGHETFTIGDDNTILVGGVNPESTTYTITATTKLTGITGIRLEALTDPNFTAGGPGRFADTGNFGLSEFRVEAAPLDLPHSEGKSN